MASTVFTGILEEKINHFITAFEKTSRIAFENPITGKLNHPGEFGNYRESIAKEFLRFLIPHRLDISSGFVITPNDSVSTQCDIIIYDRNSSPLIQNLEMQRFFPVETVCGIGEIKSNMSKAEFKVAINKLARNKILKEVYEGENFIFRYTAGKYDPKNFINDNIFTFIICNNFDFNIVDYLDEIDSWYDSDIQEHQKHNVILSINDGLICYHTIEGMAMMHPKFRNEKLKDRIIVPVNGSKAHFYTFSQMLFLSTSYATICYPDLVNYVRENVGEGMNYVSK